MKGREANCAPMGEVIGKKLEQEVEEVDKIKA